MEQQQFKVSFSVGTKLLIGVVTLLILVIGFLDVSTILLVKEDKRAFTFQAQATEASLAGKEFINNAKYSLNTLRLAVNGLNTPESIRAHDPAALRQIIESQSEVVAVTLVSLDFTTGQADLIAQASKLKDLRKAGFELADIVFPEKSVKPLLPDLQKTGIAFLGLSRPGKPPFVSLLYYDPASKNGNSGVVAIGYLVLAGFGADLKASKLTLSTRRGQILFDSDSTRMFGDKSLAQDPLFTSAVSTQLSSGAQEYDVDGVHFLGSYFKPGLDIVVLTKTEWRKAMRATYALAEKFVLLGLMSIGAAILFAILFAKTITAPLAQLYQATRQVAAGNFNVSLTSKSRDEIGALSGSFVAMSAKINDLIEESIKNAHLENELAIASTVQQTLFPPALHKTPRALIRSHYQAAAECGGDWWGFFEVGDRMALMIADATGHGIPSALITAAARSCYSVMNKLAKEDPKFAFSPGRMLSYANTVVNEAANGQINMTFFNAVLDFKKGLLTYASAGHNPPWLYKRDGKTQSLTVSGQRLGEAREVPPYEEKTVEVSPGDTLFLYTDGIIEGKDLQGTQFGKKRVRKLLDQNLGGGPEPMIEKLLADFLAHNTGKQLDDDITLAAVKILKAGG